MLSDLSHIPKILPNYTYIIYIYTYIYTYIYIYIYIYTYICIYVILGGKHQFQIVLYDHSCLEWSSPILDRNLGEYDFLQNTSGIRIKWIQTQDYHVFRMYSCRTGHGMHEKSWEYILSEQKLKTKNSWLRANSLKKWWVSTKKYGFFSGSKRENVNPGLFRSKWQGHQLQQPDQCPERGQPLAGGRPFYGICLTWKWKKRPPIIAIKILSRGKMMTNQ